MRDVNISITDSGSGIGLNRIEIDLSNTISNSYGMFSGVYRTKMCMIIEDCTECTILQDANSPVHLLT